MSMRWNKLCVAALSVAALIMPLALAKVSCPPRPLTHPPRLSRI